MKHTSKTALYNITRYLQKCYDEKREPDPNLMALVNFAEGGNLQHEFSVDGEYRNFTVEIKETLAQNCMNYLPFPAYEKYITEAWIEYTGSTSENIMVSAIVRRNIELIERIHELTLKRALDDNNYAYGFERDILTPIMKIADNVMRYRNNDYETSSDFAIRYLTLLKKTSAEKKYFSDKIFRPGKNPTLKYTKNINWLKNVENDYNQSNKESIFEVFSTLAWHKSLNVIFIDGLSHLLKEHKDINVIKNILGIGVKDEDGKNVLGDALVSGNSEIVELLIQSLNLTSNDCLAAYEEKAASYISIITNNSRNGIQNAIDNCFNSTYSRIKATFFSELETKYLPYFAIGSDTELKNDTLKNKNVLGMPLFPEEQTLQYAIYLAQTIQKYNESSSNEKLLWTNTSSLKKPIYYQVAQHLLETDSSLLKEVNLRDITIEQIAHLEKDMAELPKFAKLKNSNISNSNLSMWFKVFILDNSLPDSKESKTAKVKI